MGYFVVRRDFSFDVFVRESPIGMCGDNLRLFFGTAALSEWEPETRDFLAITVAYPPCAEKVTGDWVALRASGPEAW